MPSFCVAAQTSARAAQAAGEADDPVAVRDVATALACRQHEPPAAANQFISAGFVVADRPASATR